MRPVDAMKVMHITCGNLIGRVMAISEALPIAELAQALRGKKCVSDERLLTRDPLLEVTSTQAFGVGKGCSRQFRSQPLCSF